MLKHLTVLVCNRYVMPNHTDEHTAATYANDTGLWRYIANCIDIPRNEANNFQYRATAVNWSYRSKLAELRLELSITRRFNYLRY